MDATQSDSNIEPLFKYLRLACDLREIVKNSTISAVRANTKVMFVGTSWGDLFVLDHEGACCDVFSDQLLFNLSNIL